jgi:hypothetical protein
LAAWSIPSPADFKLNMLRFATFILALSVPGIAIDLLHIQGLKNAPPQAPPFLI